MSRRIDILIWGASGYTGSCAAEYLARNYPPSKGSKIKWAISGRTLSKLEEIKKLIVKIDESCKDIEILTADNNNPTSIDSILSQTKIVVSYAGPYTLCGSSIVDSCLRVGTHYCDITGEIIWVKKAIMSNHNVAKEKNIVLIPCCGFDSVPSDIASFMMVEHAKKKLHDEVKNVTVFFSSKNFGKYGSAGGTIRSALASVEKLSAKDAKEYPDVNYLIEHGQIQFKESQSDVSFWKYNKFSKSYQVLNPMVFFNKKIVIRSASFLKYGSQFSYNEYLKTDNIFISCALSITILLFFALIQFSVFRSLVKRFLSEPGVGPNREDLKKSSFRLDIRAVTLKNKQVITGHIQSEMDPAYGETAKMSVESAITLLQNLEEIISSGKTGFQTPSSVLGEKLVERLRNAKMEISIH